MFLQFAKGEYGRHDEEPNRPIRGAGLFNGKEIIIVEHFGIIICSRQRQARRHADEAYEKEQLCKFKS